MLATYPNMLWTVIWSQGPHDNPTDGVFEVEARDFRDAVKQAIERLGSDADCIDGVIRSDIWSDL